MSCTKRHKETLNELLSATGVTSVVCKEDRIILHPTTGVNAGDIKKRLSIPARIVDDGLLFPNSLSPAQKLRVQRAAREAIYRREQEDVITVQIDSYLKSCDPSLVFQRNPSGVFYFKDGDGELMRLWPRDIDLYDLQIARHQWTPYSINTSLADGIENMIYLWTQDHPYAVEPEGLYVRDGGVYVSVTEDKIDWLYPISETQISINPTMNDYLLTIKEQYDQVCWVNIGGEPSSYTTHREALRNLTTKYVRQQLIDQILW